jgi:biotin carboxyl carrier protein
MMEGKVGNQTIRWKSPPRGKSGEAIYLDEKGVERTVRYVRDEQGLWLETPQGFYGFDVRRFVDDEGQATYSLLRRKNFEVLANQQFLRAGESAAGGAGKSKKGGKLKAQMPGKIVKILVKAGDAVKKGDRLLVMEAMKMENEIKAAQDGVIKELKVNEGQAVETGAELLKFE